MPKRDPLTAQTRARILELHAQGGSCRGIAREVGCSASAVSKVVNTEGSGFDTTRTEAATRVKRATNAERRALAISRLYDRAEAVLDRLDAPTYKAVGFSKDGYAVVTAIDRDAVPAGDDRALSSIAINALTAAARLEAVDAAHGDAAEAQGILGSLQDALSAAAGSMGGRGIGAAGAAVDAELERERSEGA